jgi:hypothetical protein
MKRIAYLLLVVSAVLTGAALAATGKGQSASRPTVAVRSAQTTEEGQVAVFLVSLSRPAARPAKVRFGTAAGSASSGGDYRRAKGTLVFKRGQKKKTVRVAVVDDSSPEAAETFSLVLSHAQGARIGKGKASVAIAKSDLPTFTLHATMDGPQETGLQGDPTALGTASFTFDAAAEQFSYIVTVERATAPFTFGHIHPGRPPDIRGFVTELTELPPLNGTVSGSKHLELSAILDLYRTPSAFWAQLHKETNPTVGTIGGPLTAS